MISIALALALQSAPPPYLQYMEEAEALGRASYLGGVCTGLGMVETHQDELAELVQDFWRRAIIDRTDSPMLAEAISRGTEREKAAIQTLLDLGPDDGSDRRQRREDQAADYIGKGCADLTLDYPAAFTWVGK